MLWLIQLLIFHRSLSAHASTESWARIPIRQSVNMAEGQIPFWPSADLLIGTPPQNVSMLVDIKSNALLLVTPDCLFCPSGGMYDQRYSSSAQVNTSDAARINYMAGAVGSEIVTLGGVVQQPQAPAVFINQISEEYYPRFIGAQFGLLVPKDERYRNLSVLAQMESQGRLLNPVWGLRLGGHSPQLTIGALDPSDYEGEINWVPAVDDWSTISVDALKGYQGNVIPAQYPLNVDISSTIKEIYLPDINVIVRNESLIGPRDTIYFTRSDNQTFGLSCNGSARPVVDFSVEINGKTFTKYFKCLLTPSMWAGVDYPINREDMVLEDSNESGVCDVAAIGAGPSVYKLGVVFLRSIYLAYRFPTASCPAFWGFAAPKGVSLPTPTTKQTPRVTPADARSCLAFTAPTSTPAPTIQPGSGGSMVGSDGVKYRVYGRPDEAQVELRGVAGLPALKAVGAVSGF